MEIKKNTILNMDCMSGMGNMGNNSVDFTLTDIPYDAVSRPSNGLRVLDKSYADKLTFDLSSFLDEIYRITKNSICIFCGKEQFSTIYAYFANKKGTVRPIIWEKTNPSPMNGKYVYESGVELAVWFKKTAGKTFNAFCKNTVFRYPSGVRKIHPTQKNVDLFKELIKDNSNEGDLIFDPCIGSGTTAVAARELKRDYYGFELNAEAYIKCQNRLTFKNGEVNFIILDLFCGAGGLSYGMHKNEHFKTAVALDFNEDATNTFKKNMQSTVVITGDITDEETKKKIIALSKEKGVNMIVGGPPCQGYSMKGKKMGLNDPRNFLFREYMNIVKEIQPEVFVIENVKALLSTANGWFRKEIVNAINGLGYTVNYGVLNAKNFGVPQNRERAIFICSKHISIELPKGSEELVTVRDAISDLAYLNSGEGEFEQEYKNLPKTAYQKKMRVGCKSLYNHVASKHKQIAIDKLKMIPAEKGKECLPEDMLGNQKFNTTWGRLTWDKQSPTIDTRFDTPSNGTNSHPELNRAITPREAARIQSFDDCFIFYGKKTGICKQIGNAVPPLLAKGIADSIYEGYMPGDARNGEKQDT